MRQSIIPILLLGFLLSCDNSTQQEASSTSFYNNPILAGWYPDPSITDDGNGNFYMVHSTFAFYPGIPIFHSRDLVNWKQIGHVLDRPEQLDLEGFRVSRAIFAPDISYDNGTFYVTCTVVDGKGNFVVTTEDPAGSWSNPVWLPEVIGIDPGLFFDDNGKSYVVYNSDAPDNKPLYSGHRTIRMVEFDKERLEVISDNRILINGGVDITEKPIWAEGPRIYKLNGYYYLMTAEGGTAINHSEVIYRTKKIEDDFIPFEGNPILTQRHLDPNRENPITSAGHADIVQHPNGDWYGIFLACRDYGDDHYNTGRETFLTPVKWEKDWPIFDLDGEGVKYQYPVPQGVEIDEDLFPMNGNFSFKDEFEEGELGFHWMFLRTVRERWYNMNDGNSGLSIDTRPETISGTSNPSFIGHRQQHLKGKVSVSLYFSPNAVYEKAGLVAFQNETHYYFVGKTLIDGEPAVFVEKGAEGESELVTSQSLNGNGELRLKIEFDTSNYTLLFSEGNSEWKELTKLDSKYLSTKEAGGFVGVTLAMYTTSSGSESTNKAQYKWYEYVGDDSVFN